MSPRRFRPLRTTGIPLALAGLLLCTAQVAGAKSAPVDATAVAARRSVATHASCNSASPRVFRCLSLWRRVVDQPKVTAATLAAAVAIPTAGYGPADIRSAYKLPSKGGTGQTVAIVDAYDNPNVEANLASYRKAWGLSSCTTANKCFRKIDQRGGKKYPDGDSGWGVEIALDVQAVSAACPNCSIMLVEADDASIESMGVAVNAAVKLGAKVVSNSYGLNEFNGALALGKKYYTHRGVAIVASSGDNGFTAASFPAMLSSTWAVGGTTLNRTKKGGWTEDAWDGAGSGCSAWVAKPSWQKDSNCGMRTVADVSAVADPKTGFAVYDTYGLGADNGWVVVGGTSLAAPLISGMIGLAGNASKADQPWYAYAHRSGLTDVVGGSNGYCGGDYLCTGLKGYDAPTGWGSPTGLSAL
jgi:hypothetical protein